MPRLLHHSSHPLPTGPIRTRTGELTIDVKPSGLWVSVEGEEDWRSYCEEINRSPGEFVTEVVLHPDANVLWLPKVAGIDAFHDIYSALRSPGLPATFPNVAINWPKVAEHHDGIIIAPYQWSRRPLYGKTAWYYSWDCASGCIWNSRAVAELRPLPALEERSS